MTNDTGSPLALIAAILERHQSVSRPALSVSFAERSVPAFDPQILHSAHQLPPSQANISQRVASWGLPENVSNQITTLLTEESSQCQALVQRARAEVLGRLIKASVAPDPSVIPSLVESTCNAVYQSAVENMLLGAQGQVEAFGLNDDDVESDNNSDSASESEGGNEDEEDEDMFDEQEGEEDNAPMKPGEEIPPLETKYLPIFDALHERGKVLTKPEKTYLVNMTGMTYRQITIWFQNRRRGELKESMNMATSYSKASSTRSDGSSELSDQELEKTLGSRPPNTTFDIRSWRLQSALATKDDNRGSIPPLSPLKFNFPSTVDAPDTQSDDTDLSGDSDDDISMPPGLQAPSLTTSMTTVDSSIASHASTSVAKGPALQPPATLGDPVSASKDTGHPRPIRSLPSSRRSNPSTSPQQAQHQYSHSANAQHQQYRPHQSVGVVLPPSQCISSNENGLTVNLDATSRLQTSTLRSSPVSVSLPPTNTFVPGPASISPSPPSTSAGSPQRQHSPTSTSPRPQIKPLPRRTGCAPRPRPPPRSGSSVPTPASSLSRPSVVLPPSSNPSLGNTTLGTLLRPNPPGPVIPQEIEERLTAMAGRMGVGISSNPGARPSISTSGGASGSSALPNRVLDSTLGKPAANVNVRLEAMEGSAFVTLASGQTDSDGRCTNLLPAEPRLEAGVYKMIFNTGEYFEKDKRDTFYPVVE
ncbi:hypothetical protein FRC11_010409, partial [Ceratobasidium sp. 423]